MCPPKKTPCDILQLCPTRRKGRYDSCFEHQTIDLNDIRYIRQRESENPMWDVNVNQARVTTEIVDTDDVPVWCIRQQQFAPPCTRQIAHFGWVRWSEEVAEPALHGVRIGGGTGVRIIGCREVRLGAFNTPI